MTSIGAMAMPPDFVYRDVFLRGKPQHDSDDPFWIRHPKMRTGHRAMIFAAFDALKGFSEAVSSKNILYQSRKDLSIEEREEIDRRLIILHNLTWNTRMARANRVTVSVSYYAPCTDRNSEAFGFRGQYRTTIGICWKVDPDYHRTIQVGEKTIEFDDILSIDSPMGLFEKKWEMEYPDG